MYELNISCVWIESEISGCKTKKQRCSEIEYWKVWCETRGAIEDESECLWVEGNIDIGMNGNCMNEVWNKRNI
jgi:hypothetical protein